MIIFAHGLEGSPNGAKVQALRAAGLVVVAPDGQGLVLAGSSYGGLAAAWLARELGPRIDGLLLLAPALHHSEAPVHDASALCPPEGIPTVIIHGLRDDVVPIGASRAYLAAGRAVGAPVTLLEVDDDHGLHGSLDLIVAQARALLRG